MKKFLIIIVCILLLTGCSSSSEEANSNNNQNDELPVFTIEELNQFDGKSGNLCYVAVSGRVYEIKNSSKWINGVHTESDGDASCGRDLTEEMKRAPHGVSILTTSPKVTQVGRLSL